MDSYTIRLFWIGLLMVMSFLFSATETALLALGPVGVHRVLEEERRRSRLLQLWRDQPNHVLASILIVNNIVNILASALATNLASDFLENQLRLSRASGWAVAMAVGVMTFMIVVFGEVVPKTYAKHNAYRLIPLFPITYLFCYLVRPFASILQRATGWVISTAGGSVGTGTDVTAAEIETMIRLGTEQGVLTDEKKELLASVIEFTETLTKEIMVARTDVVALSTTDSLEEVLKTVRERRFSRYPVYEGDLDTVVGIVTVKDILDAVANPGVFSLVAIARSHKTLFVPETKKIGELLRELQRERVQMAIAVDEFGGTAGIVTMEDVIEEIVGEIYDEHEKSEPTVRQLEEGRYLVQGRAPIEELSTTFGVKLPEQDNYETVGGLVMTQAGKVPLVGETVEYAGLRFEVRERTRTRILALLVSRVEGDGL